MNHYIAPYANKNRLDFENKFTKYNVNFKDVHLELAGNIDFEEARRKRIYIISWL